MSIAHRTLDIGNWLCYTKLVGEVSRVKAIRLKSNIEYVLDHFYGQGIRKVLSALSDKDIAIVARPNMLAKEWIPLDTFLNFNKAVADQLYNGNYDVIKEMASFGAERELQGVYLKALSPAFLIKRAPVMLKLYYNLFSSQVKMPDKNSVELSVIGFKNNDWMVEYDIIGWCIKALELGGAKNVSYEIVKSIKDNNCFFVKASWK